MKKLLLFSLLLTAGCSHKESHQVVCVADFSSIPYVTDTIGAVFTVTVGDKTYLTFIDNNGKRKVFDQHYQCRIGE